MCFKKHLTKPSRAQKRIGECKRGSEKLEQTFKVKFSRQAELCVCV